MEFAFYILSVLLLILCLLLFLPLSIRINNKKHIYEIGIFNILKIKPVFNVNYNNNFYINLQFLFFDFKYDIISKIAKTKISKKKKNITIDRDKNKSKKSIDYKRVLGLANDLLMSFKIHYFKLNIDTSNYILNGMLIPVFEGIRNEKTKLNINFNQYYEIDLKISNKIANIIFPLIKFFIIRGAKK